MQNINTAWPDIRVEKAAFNATNLAAVALLVSRHPPFIQYAFGLMMARLVDQLSYQSNVMIIKNDVLVAYAGWLVVQTAEAEKWLAEGGELPAPDWHGGDSVIVTMTVTEHRDFLFPLMRAVSHLCAGKKVFRMRTYQNGKADARRMPITGHVQSLFIKTTI